MVELKVGDQIIDITIDTGAEISVVTETVAPLSRKATATDGVTGEQLIRPFLPALEMPDLGTSSDS